MKRRWVMSASRPLKTRKLGAALSLILAAMTVATLNSTVSIVAANRGLRVEQPITASGAAAGAGNPTPARDPVVVGCPTDQARLANWKAIGVRFEGHWRSEELNVALDVLDRYALTFGEAQLSRLIHEALRLDILSRSGYLAFVRTSGPSHEAAGWMPLSGKIRLNDVLFNRAVMAIRYRWSFLDACNDASTRSVSIQEAVVAHELGHVVIDGTRVARGDLGATTITSKEDYADFAAHTLALEEAYVDEVSVGLWPHPTCPVYESVATEIGLWALGLRRPPPVCAYREDHLAPVLIGATAFGPP
jgi:hypothetical protein